MLFLENIEIIWIGTVLKHIIMSLKCFESLFDKQINFEGNWSQVWIFPENIDIVNDNERNMKILIPLYIFYYL